MSSDLSHEYSVGPFLIKEKDGQFFISTSSSTRYGRPYKTLRHACLAASRKMEAQFVERKNRREAFNKKFLVKRRAA